MFIMQHKELANADIPGGGSHQHEIGVPQRAQVVFDGPHRWLPVTYHFFSESGERHEEAFVTSCYYNTREGKPRRPEYRLYYPHSIESQLKQYTIGDHCLFLQDLDRLPHVLLWRNPDLFSSGIAALSATECIERAPLSQTSYRTVDVSSYISAGGEPSGNKPKRWFYLKSTNGITALFKEQRPQTAEAATEKICAELAYKLRLQSPLTLLAFDGARFGILSVTFYMSRPQDSLQFSNRTQSKRKKEAFQEFNDEGEIPGSTVLQRAFEDYIEDKRSQRQYTVQNILHALQVYEVPEDVAGRLIQYFIFDAYVGNTDRHHDNWSLVASQGKQKSLHLSPTFDHGPSLGGTMPVKKRRTWTTDPTQMERFYRKGRSAIFGKDDYLSFTELVQNTREAEKQFFGNNDYSDEILGRIAKIRTSDLELILDRIPEAYLSTDERDFILAYLGVTRETICRF